MSAIGGVGIAAAGLAVGGAVGYLQARGIAARHASQPWYGITQAGAGVVGLGIAGYSGFIGGACLLGSAFTGLPEFAHAGVFFGVGAIGAAAGTVLGMVREQHERTVGT